LRPLTFMTKKNIFLALLAVVLGGVYVVYFTDWFKPKTVQIFHTFRPVRQLRAKPRDGVLPDLRFGINQKLRITDLKVVSVEALQTNEHALPTWHLVSDSNSVPLGQFFYGQGIPGMRPAVNGSRSQPLATNVTYRLFVTAGNTTGQHDFELK